MAVFILSAASKFDYDARVGGVGIDLWSSAPGVSSQMSIPLDVPSEVTGLVAGVCIGLRKIRDIASPGDVVQIAIPDGEAALSCFKILPKFGTPGQQLHTATYWVIEELEAKGIEVRWLDPVRNHSGIHHAYVMADLGKATMESEDLPLVA